MSHMCTTLPILYPWAHATAYYPHAPSQDTQWRAGQLFLPSIITIDINLLASTSCHMGNSIIYDTVTKWNWSVDVRMHPIKVIINELLAVDWDIPPKDATGSSVNVTAVPMAKPEDDCVVSFCQQTCEILKFSHALRSTGMLPLGIWSLSGPRQLVIGFIHWIFVSRPRDVERIWLIA